MISDETQSITDWIILQKTTRQASWKESRQHLPSPENQSIPILPFHFESKTPPERANQTRPPPSPIRAHLKHQWQQEEEEKKKKKKKNDKAINANPRK